MRHGLTRLVVGCVVLGLTVATVARAEAPDTSTPTKAAVAFAKAVAAGDMAAAKSLSTGTDAQYALLQKVSDLVSAMSRLEAAAVKKFGAGAKLPKEMAMDMVADFEAAEVKVDGERATLVIKGKDEDKFPPTLKKDGNGWKVDLANFDADPAASAMAPMIPAIVKAVDAVTKGTADGKYATAVELFTDLGAQMGAAVTPTGADAQ